MNGSKRAMSVAIAGMVLASGLAMGTGQPEREYRRPLESAPVEEVEGAEREESRAVVEVVFVLDTTGSMSGLIQGAKEKIWSIANAIVMGEPRPEVRMGLVAYRDRSDAYVTKRTALTDDLDAVYADLMGYVAAGGGDTPESVNQALAESVGAFDWSEGDDVLRLVYLVGDAPPHMDYEQDTPYQETCEVAARKGLIINAVQCGRISQTTPVWQEIARLAEGEYFQIDQSGGMQGVRTPFDEDIAALGEQLEGTVVAYGTLVEQASARKRTRLGAELAGEATEEALADRAVFKAAAGGASLGGRKDLVRDFEEGKVDLASLPREELPEALRELNAREQAAYLREQVEARAALSEKILALQAKRQAFVKEELERRGGTADSFDRRVLESLRRQAKRIGVEYAKDDG